MTVMVQRSRSPFSSYVMYGIGSALVLGMTATEKATMFQTITLTNETRTVRFTVSSETDVVMAGNSLFERWEETRESAQARIRGLLENGWKLS